MRRALAAGWLLLVASGCLFPPTDDYPCRSHADCLGLPGGRCEPATGRCSWPGRPVTGSSGNTAVPASSGASSSSSSGGSSAGGGSSGAPGSSSGTDSGGASSSAGNLPPVVQALELDVDAGASVVGELVVADPEGDRITLSVGVQPARGSVTLDGTARRLTYTAPAATVGDDVLLVSAVDGRGAVGTGRVTVHIHSTAAPDKTWVGGAPGGPTAWEQDDNWTPPGVPAATHVVDIPPTVNAPLLSTATQVAGLVVEPAATLDVGSAVLSVTALVAYGVVQGGSGHVRVVTGALPALVLGDVPGLEVQAATAVVGPLRVRRDLTINGQDGALDIGNAAVDVDGELATVGRGTLAMQNVLGRVRVAGAVSLAGGDLRGKLTAGTLEARAAFHGDWGFQASAPHRVEFLGPSVAAVSVDATAQFGNVRAESSLQLQGATRVAGDLELAGSAQVAGTAGTTLRVDGALTVAPLAGVELTGLRLEDPTGTALFDGSYQVSTLTLAGAEQQLRADLPYADVLVRGSTTLPDGMHLSGSLDVSATGSEAQLGGSVTVDGDLTVTQYAVLQMATTTANLVVLGNVNFSGGAAVGSLSAGTLTVHGSFTGYWTGFHAEGQHRVVLAGGNSQTVSLDGAGATNATFQDLEIAGAGGAFFSAGFHVAGDLAVSAAALVDSASSVRGVVLGDVSTSAGSSLSVETLAVGGPLGTSQIAGTFQVTTLELAGDNQPLAAGLPYTHVVISGTGATLPELILGGNLSIGTGAGDQADAVLDADLRAQDVTLRGPGSTLRVQGHVLTAEADLRVDNYATFTQQAGDRVNVKGDAEFLSASAVTGGTLTLEGNFHAYWSGFVAQGTHLVRFSGTRPVTAHMEGSGATLVDVEVVPGKTLQVLDHLTVSGVTRVGGGVVVPLNAALQTRDLAVQGGAQATVGGAVTVTGGLTLQASASGASRLDITGTVTTADLHVDATCTVAVQAGGTLTVSGTCTVESGATLSGFACP